MFRFHRRYVSPELARLLLACAASVALVVAIYLADISFRRGGSIATRAYPSPVVAAASPTPAEAGGGTVALAEPSATPPPLELPSPSPEPPPSQRYTVKPGDSLIEIGLFFGVRTEDLIALNGLPPDGFLYAGQELIIPGDPAASPAGR